jgi:hypothetical protein
MLLHIITPQKTEYQPKKNCKNISKNIFKIYSKSIRKIKVNPKTYPTWVLYKTVLMAGI